MVLEVSSAFHLTSTYAESLNHVPEVADDGSAIIHDAERNHWTPGEPMRISTPCTEASNTKYQGDNSLPAGPRKHGATLHELAHVD